MQASLPCPDLPDRCELKHAAFATLGDVRFRRSTSDGLPMMALRLGEREAQLPLDSLRREFAIGKDSDDGRMLDLIGSALDYVSCLQPGDRLPPEIRTGEASWKPSADHVRLTTARLRLAVCIWLMPRSRWARADRTDASLLQMADNAALREEVQAASSQAAELLGLDSGEDVTRRLEELARELAHIEALRERLLLRVVALCRLVSGMLQERQRSGVPFDTLSQVHRLMLIAVKQIAHRFADVDAPTGDIASLLRDADNQRDFIRSNRDWLYRSQRAWEPILDRWARVTDTAADDIGPLLAETYHFLAPRFMPTTPWLRKRPDRTRAATVAGMAW